ncbi:hypothetical protein L3Y34_019743 [Caenorhabditis briggsae]|uniref:Uncharacterized protein n=1 Tax=Caenorhabditis briggsae TaxID=6238 RepID=A0AAE9DQT4_CAEBR|nr:hypothetical protein L3Y34_019743 [Caenorhabditis briggsae]
MLIPSLLELSASAVSSAIINGTPPAENTVLLPEVSNLIFEKFVQNFEVLVTRRQAKDICTSLNISKIDLRHKVLRRIDFWIIRNQNLISLALGDLSGLETFTIDHSEYFIKIHPMLQRLLNSESQKNLMHLDISGFEGTFTPKWICRTTKMLPSLKHLIISGRKIHNREIRKIGKHLPNLQFLEISNTGITRIDGISKLKKLEILGIGGLNSEDSGVLMELFELKNLRVLDLSRKNCVCCEKTQLLNQYLSCNKILPNLEFIDCSGTLCTNESVWKLAKSHPRLRKISIIETEATLSEIPNLEIMSLANLSSCVKCLKWYKTQINYPITASILREIRNFLDADYSIFKESEIRGCFEVVCETIETFPDGQSIHRLIADVLYQMIRNGRIYPLSVPQRHDMVHHLLNILDFWQNWYGDVEQTKTVELVWACLTDEIFLTTPNLNLRQIFEVALENVLFSEIVQENCLISMVKSLHFMDSKGKEQILKDSDYCRKVLNLLHSLYTRGKAKMYKLVFKLINKADFEDFVRAGGITVLCRHLKKYSFCKSLKFLIKLATRIPESEVTRSEFFKWENLGKLVRFFKVCKKRNSKNLPMIKHKTYLISSLFSIILASVNSENRQFFENHEKMLKSEIENFAPNSMFPYKLSTFRHIFENSKFDGPVLWALYTIQVGREHDEFPIYRNLKGLDRILRNLEMSNGSKEIREKAMVTREVVVDGTNYTAVDFY